MTTPTTAPTLREIELRDIGLDIDVPVEVVKSTYCLVEDDTTYMVFRDHYGKFNAGPVVVKDGPWGEKHIIRAVGSFITLSLIHI